MSRSRQKPRFEAAKVLPRLDGLMLRSIGLGIGVVSSALPRLEALEPQSYVRTIIVRNFHPFIFCRPMCLRSLRQNFSVQHG